MVLQRTIENLRERPRHERQAVAFWIAVSVVIILLIGWGTFFIRTVSIPDLRPVNDAYNHAVQQASAVQSQVSTPADNTGWVSTATEPTGDGGDNTEQMQIIQDDQTSDTVNSAQ